MVLWDREKTVELFHTNYSVVDEIQSATKVLAML